MKNNSKTLKNQSPPTKTQKKSQILLQDFRICKVKIYIQSAQIQQKEGERNIYM